MKSKCIDYADGNCYRNRAVERNSGPNTKTLSPLTNQKKFVMTKKSIYKKDRYLF